MKGLYHGYFVVVATFLLNMVALGTYYSAAVLLLPLGSTFPAAGRGEISCLPSIYLSMALFASLPAGLIQDVLQSRGISIKPVFAFGGLCLGLGCLASSYGTTLGGILMVGAPITGIGIGLTGFVAAGICVQWFDSNRGTMLLLAMAGSGSGNFLYCNAMHWLMEWFSERDPGCLGIGDGGGIDTGVATGVVGGEECQSWRYAMRVAGVISMVVALVASTVMRLPCKGELEQYEKGRLALANAYDVDDVEEGETDSFVPLIAPATHLATVPSSSAVAVIENGTARPPDNVVSYGTMARQMRRIAANGGVHGEKGERASLVASDCSSLGTSATDMRSVLTLNQTIRARQSFLRRMSSLATVGTSADGGGDGGGVDRRVSKRSGSGEVESRRPSEASALAVATIAHQYDIKGSERTLHNRRSRRRSSIAEYEALSHLPVNYRHSIADTLRSTSSVYSPATNSIMLSPMPGEASAVTTCPLLLSEFSVGEVCRTRTTICLLLWSLVSSFAFTNFFVHVPAYAASVGLSSSVGSEALSLTGLCMLLGNLTLGGLTDRIGPIRTLQITMMILVVLIVVWPHCSTPARLYEIASLYGYMSTTQSSVPLVILADAFGEVSPQSILTLVGLQNVCKFPGYFLGPMVVGHLYEIDEKTYNVAAWFTALFMLVGNLSLFLIPSAQIQVQRLRQPGSVPPFNDVK